MFTLATPETSVQERVEIAKLANAVPEHFHGRVQELVQGMKAGLGWSLIQIVGFILTHLPAILALVNVGLAIPVIIQFFIDLFASHTLAKAQRSSVP